MGHVDSFTVESLQGKAPGASRADHDSLLGLFKIGTLFPNVPEDQRDTLWSRVCLTSTKCLIPSLSTFFADRYFLEQVADCLRNITGITKKSVSTRLANMFTDIGQEDDRCIVQVSEGRFGSIPGSQSRRRNLGIQQLWLAAFREYENVPAPMQQEGVLAKARPRIDVAALHGLASLALRLGFESAKINEILADPSDWVIAKQALLSARKPEYFEYEHEDDLATQIAGIFSRARPVAFKTRPPTCTSQSPKLKRHGVPRAADHKHDKTHLFLPNMESNIDCDQSHVTSFFVRMSMYRAFFGQSPISSEEREELLTTAVATQENSDGSAAELDNGQSQEAQINEEAVRLQRLREDATAEQKKLLELRGLICIEQERFSREQAALKELQERSKAEQTSMTLHSFEDIVAKEYDEFMAVEEPTFIQVQTPYEESTIIPQEESNRSELVPSALSVCHTKTQNPTVPVMQDPSRTSHFDFQNLKRRKSHIGAVQSPVHATEQLPTPVSKTDCILFKTVVDKAGNLVESHRIEIDANAASRVNQLAAMYMKEKCTLFDTHGRNLAPASKCFDMIRATGTNVIVVKQLGIGVKAAPERGKKKMKLG